MQTSKIHQVNGRVRRSRVKGSPGQWCKEMELIQVSTRVPHWLAEWIRKQPESAGVLLEVAAVEYYGAEPPKRVLACLGRRTALTERRIKRRVEILKKTLLPNRFTVTD